MILTPRRLPRWIVTCCALAASLFLADSLCAHPRPWRHAHRRRAILVGRPVAVRTVVMVNGRPHGTIDFHVDPSTTEVYVDDSLRGTADDFDGSPQKLHLLPGAHVITLRTPDGDKVSKTIDIRAGTEIELRLDFDDRTASN